MDKQYHLIYYIRMDLRPLYYHGGEFQSGWGSTKEGAVLYATKKKAEAVRAELLKKYKKKKDVNEKAVARKLKIVEA